VVQSNGPSTLQIGIALNQCEQTLLGTVARGKHVHRVLQDQRLFFVSRLPEAVESVNMGVPMVLNTAAGKVQKKFAALAGFCGEVKSTRKVHA
jgi:hypothetical protein